MASTPMSSSKTGLGPSQPAPARTTSRAGMTKSTTRMREMLPSRPRFGYGGRMLARVEDRDLVHTTASGEPGVALHVVEDGAADRPRVVLLHGFPEHWGTWRSLMRSLVDDGYGVAAPDLRGYGGSDKPSSTSAYEMDRLLDDVEAVVRLRGHEKAHVIGHDWGGVL